MTRELTVSNSNEPLYAIIEREGTHHPAAMVCPLATSTYLDGLREKCDRCTARYQTIPNSYGGSNGGYRIVKWSRGDKSITAAQADQLPTIS